MNYCIIGGYNKKYFILYYLIGKWTVPVKTGDKFPSCSGFTIDPLPGNKAVLFGGDVIDEKGKKHTTGRVFIISFTDSCVVSTFYYSC